MNKNKCKSRQNIFVDLNFSTDMFDITDKTKLKIETINAPSSFLLETITCSSVPNQNYMFQNKSNYLVVDKITILKDEDKIIILVLLTEKKNICYIIFQKIFSVIMFLKIILLKRYTCLITENCNYKIKLICQK
jgi:hypothetical protein